MRISLITAMFLLFAVFSLLSGCSISYSVGKSSDSISASSDSISDSSGGDDDEEAESTANAYGEDIAAATKHYALYQTKREQFMQTVSNIARNHGIVDWEQEKLTYTAMGRGLKQAGINEQFIGELAYFSSLLGSDDYSLVLAGYHNS